MRAKAASQVLAGLNEAIGKAVSTGLFSEFLIERYVDDYQWNSGGTTIKNP